MSQTDSKFLLVRQPVPALKSSVSEAAPSAGTGDIKSNHPVMSLLGRDGSASKALGKSVSITMTKRTSGRKKGRKSAGFSLPPAIECTPIVRHTYRFFANATATVVNVTVANLLVAMGGICTVTNSTISSFCTSVKVRKVSVWSGVVTTGAVNAEIVWENVGSNFSPDKSRETSVPEGITMERVLASRPPKGSLASFWLPTSASAGVVFQLTCQAGSIIDVQLEGTLGNNFSNVGGTGYAVAVLNSIYYGRLDGVGGKFQPLGLPTTN